MTFTSIVRALYARKDKSVCANVKDLIFNRVLSFLNLQMLQSCEWLGFKTLPQEVQSARKVDPDLHMVRGHAHTHATQCDATLRPQRVKQSNKKQNKTVTSKDAGCNTRSPSAIIVGIWKKTEN